MIPDTATTSNAQKKVLSTPDLLIIILSQLPHSSLLKARLANKAWASLFGNVEIQASLFESPRPKGSALYTETYSDVLMDKFSAFWSIRGEESDGEESGREESGGEELDKVVLPESSVIESRHLKERNETPVDILNIHDPSEQHRQETTVQLRIPEYIDKSHKWQWRQLLLCQPAVEVLEIVQQVNRRTGGTLEFRAIIPRPNGLRMGFLYDAVRHWNEVERSPVELLWDRKTGDLVDRRYIYVDGPGYRTVEDKPCVTIWGKTSVGCGQYGGLTYANYMQIQKPRARVIRSGDEAVEFSMSDPKLIRFDLSFII